MLIGYIDGKVGEKYQVAFPKKFREILGKKLIVTKGLDANLILVSEANWKTLLEGTESKPFINKDAREVQRFLLGNASYITIDSQGRFVLPEYLREHAGIGKEIVFAGLIRFVEIWDKKRWVENQKQLSETIPSVAERLSERKDIDG